MRALELTTRTGRIFGTGDGSVAHWRGLPYAAAPVGARRWRAPEPPEPWTGLRDAAEFGPVCPQPKGLASARPRTQQSEDCLTLNVTAPADPQSDALPVMVFLHGGGFLSGAGSEPAYDGSALVRRGQVVYVSINYRLGAWGWLHFDEYASAELSIDSNVGLRDQLAALRWVQDNIAEFGGDPGRVTVFGESAGAIAITALLACPTAEGLFAGAILQSAAPRVIPPIDHAHVWAREFLSVLGADPQDPAGVRVRLTEVSADELITALAQLSQTGLKADPSAIAVTPTVDGELVPRLPMAAVAAGEGLNVPVIIGTNDREGTLFSHFSPTRPSLRPTWRQMATKARSFVDPAGDFDQPDHGQQPPEAVLRKLYPGYPRQRGALADLAGDGAFWYPSVELAEACSAHAPAWSYRFDFAPRLLKALRVNATHGGELLPLFGRFDTDLARFVMVLGGKEGYAGMSESMQAQWVHFARHLRPQPDWPQYEATERATMIFDSIERIELDPRGERRRAWEAVTRRVLSRGPGSSRRRLE